MPDEITQDFIGTRELERHKCHTAYSRPDADAEYTIFHEIDITNVRSFIARYPKPDDVVPVTEEGINAYRKGEEEGRSWFNANIVSLT